jgi:nicotinic acid mononucleotide adenylyltransferase
MAGINHLYDLYNKKGADFIQALFSQYVTINEKMDGSAFSFERDPNTGKFNFYRRDQRNPITLVDRTLMKYYERPIQYIESLPPNILEKIPRGWRFGLEYFANTSPVEIVYDRIPKNHLILSFVHKMDANGKIVKTIQEKSKLDTWADLLGVERSPIIFQGNLDETQKSQLMEFLATPFQQLVQKFSTQSFVRFIISILNPELKSSALNKDLDKDVEGVVFRFGEPDAEGETVLAKMVDPLFTELAKTKSQEKREKKPSDFLGITLLDVMNFILQQGVDSFEVEGEGEDERYISFISDVFAKFLEENEEKYRGADFEEPDYLKKPEFRLNRDLVRDRRVLKFVEEDEAFESLYKLILNSFRKLKTRASGIVTSGTLSQLNLLIQEIKDYIQRPEKEVNESQFVSFLDFKKETQPNVDYVLQEGEDSEKDENPLLSFEDFISKLETIENQTPPTDEPLVEKEDDRKINVIMGRFQPFHLGHLKMAKKLHEENKLPTFVVVVYPGHNKSGNSPFDEATIKQYMDAVVKENSDVLVDYMIVSRGLLGSAINKLVEMGFEPHLVGAGEDRQEDYEKQMDYIKRTELFEKLPEDFKLVETPRSTSATEVRKKLKDEDYAALKKMLPKSVLNLYSGLASELNKN